MGIKTTYNIDRETAIEVIKLRLDNLSNEYLAEILLVFDESYFRNYSVTNVLPNDDWYKIVCVDEF